MTSPGLTPAKRGAKNRVSNVTVGTDINRTELTHLENLVVCQALVRGLGLRQCFEFDEDRVQEFGVGFLVLGLVGVDLRDQFLKLRTAPFDGVEFFANEHFQPMSWTFFRRDVTGGNRATFAHSGLIRILTASLLFSFKTIFVGGLDQLCLSSLELHSSLVSPFHLVLQVAAVGRQPDVTHAWIEQFPDPTFIHVFLWHRREQDGARRKPAGVEWRHEIGLAKVNEVDALAGDGVEDETEVNDGASGMSEQLEIVVLDVGHGQKIKL